MKDLKKHVILGGICLVCLVLALVDTMFVPYLAFCACSLFVLPKGKKLLSIIAVIVGGLVILPAFDFIYAFLTAPLRASFLVDVLAIFVGAAVYFVAFILLNCCINKEKVPLTLSAGVLLVSLILVYSILVGVQSAALADAMEQGTILAWLSQISQNVLIKFLSQTAFYGAVFVASARFVKKI